MDLDLPSNAKSLSSRLKLSLRSGAASGGRKPAQPTERQRDSEIGNIDNGGEKRDGSGATERDGRDGRGCGVRDGDELLASGRNGDGVGDDNGGVPKVRETRRASERG